MLLCSQCPDNPACSFCLDELGAGSFAQKVMPPRSITIVHLASGKRMGAKLLAVSRVAIGICAEEARPSGRYEVELAADFRIIGSAVQGVSNQPYFVLDIEKVLRKDDVLERLLLEEFHSWHLSHELEPTAILADFDDRDDERRKLIKEELHKLAILRQIQEIYMLIWEKGRIRPLGQMNTNVFDERELLLLVEKAVASASPLREQLVSHERRQIYDVHLLPLPDKTCGIAIINVTEAIAAERERQSKEWDLYRQVFSLVTHGKLELLRDSQLYELIRRGEKIFSLAIAKPDDLAGLRSKLKQALAPFSLPDKRLLHYIVAVNEAASNTLKHGHGGSVDFYHSPSDQTCRAVVFDQGAGILLEELPKVTLLNGYSTRKSLGAGFHVMLQYSSKLCLNSSAFGTKIVLEINCSQQEMV